MAYKGFTHHREKRDAERAAAAAAQEIPMTDETLTHAPIPAETPSATPAVATLDPTAMAVIQALTAQFAEALKGVTGQQVSPEQQANLYANAMRVALRPENQDPPLESAYNPAGDRDHPRAAFKCQMRMMNVDLDEATHTVEEIALWNLLEPGDYRVDKTDGTQVIVSVEPTMHPSGDGYSRLNLNLRASNHELNKNWFPLTHVLRQMVGDLAGTVPVMAKPSRLSVGRVTGVNIARPGAAQDLTDGAIAKLQKELPPGVLREFNAMLAADQKAI